MKTKGIKLWVFWIVALVTGVYGTGQVYNGIVNGTLIQLIYGTPIFLLGIWLTGNIWASARQEYRRQRKSRA